jgi:DNA-binding NarL/FixJ family response regulator
MIALVKDKARIWYSFPLVALASGGVWGAAATGSILTIFMIEAKKTRQHLKSELKGFSKRDMQIYELYKAGKTARKLSKMFGISKSMVRAIY